LFLTTTRHEGGIGSISEVYYLTSIQDRSYWLSSRYTPLLPPRQEFSVLVI